MPISIPTKHKPAPNGFTLVEMLVVIFLLGLASAAVVLMLPGGDSAARNDAERLAARIAAARDEAVLQARPVVFWTRASGYGFEQRFDGQWRAHPDPAFKPRNFENGTRILGASQNRILFDATGLPSSPAKIELTNGEGSSLVSVSASGEVAVAR
ncbi:GspH/FimT family pseudopilin [Sphingorhabdus pulchriflava]|nr:GspH/FimT family pseudopilin [Sphingorhabdus pulchriflava]